MLKKIISFLLDTTETIVISLSLVAVVYLFLGRPTEVLGYSMEPSLDNGQKLIIQNSSLPLVNLKRGDIVVVHSPVVSDTDYVKRIIALPKETVAIKDCKIYINSTVLTEPYLAPGTCTRGGNKMADGQLVNIPNGEYLVLGDNRERSFDGRFFGLIPKSEISGKAIIRWWPLNKWKIF